MVNVYGATAIAECILANCPTQAANWTDLANCNCVLCLTEEDCFYCATACNAVHGIAVAILSVCLSVRCVYCEKTK